MENKGLKQEESFKLGQEIIRLAEKSKVVIEFTTFNDSLQIE